MVQKNGYIQHATTDIADVDHSSYTESSQYTEEESSISSNDEETCTKKAVIAKELSEKPHPKLPQPFYRQKKYWIACTVITIIIVLAAVLLIMFVLFPIVAQFIMDGAGLQVKESDIAFTAPNDNLARRQVHDMNSTFYMKMTAELDHTGPFPANIVFQNPMNVYYNDTFIGTIVLPNTHVSSGGGFLETIAPFLIHDTTYFAKFAKDMFAYQTFTWRIRGKVDLVVFGIAATVDLDKGIYMQGMNGFPEVKITSFQLPANAPEGGISVELGTLLKNPSPIGVQLGTIALDIGYEGVKLGQVTSQGITLKKGDNELLLKGTLIPQSNQQDLEKIGVLFSNYIGGKMSLTSASGVSCAPDGINAIGWLSEGFKSIQLNAHLGLDEPLDIIHGVRLGYLDLTFTADTPYAPIVSAPAVTADFSIPFGFSIGITEVSQELKLGTDNDFASISVPYASAQSDQDIGKLQFPMNNVSLQTLIDSEQAFNDFTYALTASDLYSFQVGGNASATTSTPIGNITLSGISFKVPTSIHGLQLLNSAPTVINGVDVTGGTSENLLLAINITMENPSDFTITAGDVSFAFLASNEQLGEVTLTNLKLQRGSNAVAASSTFNPKVSQVGRNLLRTFVMGQNNDIAISGFDGSTSIASLKNALSAINIGTILPGLKERLIQGGKLVVNEDTPQSGIASVQVSVANPFSGALGITKVVLSVTYHGSPVGTISQDISGFDVTGHSTNISPALGMQMNIQPDAIALLLRTLAIDSQMDTRALDTLLSIGGFATQQLNEPNLFTNFNITSYVMQAMRSLSVDLQLSAGIKIGDYEDDLDFSQNGVPIQTDNTITRLISIVGQPIVQKIVDGAELRFETIIVSMPSDTGFKVQMRGSIINAGPMVAQIAFNESLVIYWQGQELGKVVMPTLTTQANAGAQFDVSGDFVISNLDIMGEFAGFMINSEKFVWNIRAAGVVVTAIGYTFTGITMDKYVTLDGCNAFRDAVLISAFDVPSNHPEGGISLVVNTSINNPSQIGFNLSGAAFATYYRDVELGPLASAGVANFAPKTVSNIKMTGRLAPQDSDSGLAAISEIFKNYLAAKDSFLTVKGVSGSGPGGVVDWLTPAFKTISIDSVVLPGPNTPPNLITSVVMKDLEIDFTKSTYEPPAGSKQITAQIHNPFGFPLSVNKLNMNVVAGYQRHPIANLKIPDSSGITSKTGLVATQFDHVPLTVYSDAHALFGDFIRLLLLQENVVLDLSGSVNAVVNTAIGNMKLDNITFDVGSSLGGLNNLGGTFDIQSLAVTGGTKDYIIANVAISVNNPSQISATIGDVVLDVLINEFNAKIADALLKNIIIVPGINQINVEVHVYSGDQRALSQMISSYMTGSTIPVTIKGSERSSPIPSLNPGLSALNLGTTLVGISNKLVAETLVYAGIDVAEILADAIVTLSNPLQTSLTILAINAEFTSRSKQNQEFRVATVDYALQNPMIIAAGQQATSERLPAHIIMNENNLADVVGLLFAPNPDVDITLNATVLVGDGFSAMFYYYQTQVPISFKVDLGLILSRGIGSDILKRSRIVSALPVNVLRDLGLLNGSPDTVTGPAGLTSTASDVTPGASNVSTGASRVVPHASSAVFGASNVASRASNIASDASNDASHASDTLSETPNVAPAIPGVVSDALSPVLGASMPTPEATDNSSPTVNETEPPRADPLSPESPPDSNAGVLGWLLPF